jgi:hypothetical protein
MKMTALWNVMPCSAVETDRCYRDAYCLYLVALFMERASTSETSANFYETARHNNPADLPSVCEVIVRIEDGRLTGNHGVTTQTTVPLYWPP